MIERRGRPPHDDLLTPAEWRVAEFVRHGMTNREIAAHFDCGGVRLFLSQGDGGESASILYFRVPDVHAANEELRSRGVEFTDAPHMIHRHADRTEEWMNFFKDNEGRPLAITAQVKA